MTHPEGVASKLGGLGPVWFKPKRLQDFGGRSMAVVQSRSTGSRFGMGEFSPPILGPALVVGLGCSLGTNRGLDPWPYRQPSKFRWTCCGRNVGVFVENTLLG